MILVVGLGNPEKKYAGTRHNAGFLALDAFAKEHGFPAFKLSLKSKALVSEGILGSVKVILAKPQTFMNNSGLSVKSLMKTKPGLVVVHDDIDIPIGTVKVSKDRGSAGHKGVDSIIEALRSKNFTRIRIGILPSAGKPKNVEDFILKKFSLAELPILQGSIQEAVSALNSTITPSFVVPLRFTP